MKPIAYVGAENSYYGLGDKLGNAFSMGKYFKSNKSNKS